MNLLIIPLVLFILFSILFKVAKTKKKKEEKRFELIKKAKIRAARRRLARDDAYE